MESAVKTLLSLARAHPGRPLLFAQGRSYTYGSFARCAAGLAGDLKAGGLARGERVALLLEEYDDFFISMFAVWLAGGVVVPLNTALPKADLLALVDKVRPSVVLAGSGVTLDGDGSGRDAVPAAVPAAPPVPAAALVPADVGLYKTVSAGDLREADLATLDGLDPVTPTELAMVMFTSGTTGVPKGVCQHLEAIGTNAALVAGVLGLTADDRIFINTPPYFTSGICHFLTLMACGGSTAGRLGFFFGGGLLAEMAALGCTGFGGAPAHLVRVVEPFDEPQATAALRFWVSSGDHLPPDVIARMRVILPGVRLFNMYGLTEVSGRLCVLPPDELDRRSGSVGRPIGAMTVTVRRADGSAADDGETGELFVAGPLVMQGYLDEPQITAKSLTPHGFRTGDYGRLDADGFVWIEGRHDDIIKRGGVKVSLVHIQQALRSLGQFTDVAVAAADDELAGHVPVAFVVPADPAEFKSAAVMRALRGILPAVSLPRRVVPLAAIPRTGSGKAIRAELLRLDRDGTR